MTTCSVCASPYAAVSDDPSPAHPSCAPSDPTRFEAATSGPRTYSGSMRALVWSVCAGCSERIEVGAPMELATVDGRRAWVCLPRAGGSAPESALSEPHSVATVLPRPLTSPERENATQRPAPTAPRRAA